MKVVVSYKMSLREDDSADIKLKYVLVTINGKVFDVKVNDELPYRIRKLVEELIVTTLTMGRIISRFAEKLPPQEYHSEYVVNSTDELDLVSLFNEYFPIVNEMNESE